MAGITLQRPSKPSGRQTEPLAGTQEVTGINGALRPEIPESTRPT